MASHDPSVRHLRDYISIPSVNPMDRDDLAPEIVHEKRFAEHLREQLRRLSIDAELVGESERPSVIAEVRPAGGADTTVVVASHLDTVPVDGMEIPPFDPVVASGRLYGRGSCDTKGGMAALVAALEKLLQRGGLRRNLILVGEADEEFGSLGMGAVLSALEGRRPDWVLATEPTELRVVNRHKGVAHARLEASGRACHASNPAEGENAILNLARAALGLEALAEELARSGGESGAGCATLSIGTIQGGQAPNVVPDQAFLVADRRLLPEETLAGARAEIESALSRAGISERVKLVSFDLKKPTLFTEDRHPAVRSCLETLAGMGRLAETEAVAFGTDAGVFSDAGLPGVVMGPGSIEQAHTAREFVELEQVEAMSDFFFKWLSKG
jgi:acetylornithine deacetylase